MRRKLYLETFGCQMNVLDSELVMGQLRVQGYDATESPDQADVILYNTCSVREHAEQKVWSRLGALRERKTEQPNLVIGVIGCMAERDGENLFRKFPHIDILCGPGELDKLPGMVHNASVASSASIASSVSVASSAPTVTAMNAHRVGPGRHVALMGSTSRRSSTLAQAEDSLELLDLSRSISASDGVSQAYVRITRGCNKFCTYCVVPYTRGPEVHRPPQNIIDEVRKLTDAGVKEVTLLGQTINHYAYKHGDGRTTTFADLLFQIHEATADLPRLRFVTSFPRDFTDAALQAMRDCRRICRYLHVPAQHGSDRILKMMNRGYTSGDYDDFVARARAMMPDISLASDFIVGFPTETDAEFAQSVAVIRRSRFKNSFIFKYSPRPGTTAMDRYVDDIPEDVKRQRNNELLAVQQEVSAQGNREMIGRTVEVMVEGESRLVSRQSAALSKVMAGGQAKAELLWETRTSPSDVARLPAESVTTQLTGRTRGDQIIAFDGPLSLTGEMVDVEIVDAKNLTLFAKRLVP